MNPEDEIALFNLAHCFEALRQEEEAIRYFKKFIDQEPYSEQAWFHLSAAFARKKDNERALWAIDYSLLIDPEFAAARFEKARILEHLERFKDAVQTYKEGIREDEPAGYSYFRIGHCFRKMGDAEKARIFFTKAVTDDPELEEAHLELALISDEEECWHESLHDIRQAVELDPENPDYLLIQAELMRRHGFLEESCEKYQALLEMGHTAPDIYMEYTELLFDLDEIDQGMDLLYKGVQLNPSSADIHFRLAGYLFSMEEWDEGEIYFRQALGIDPDRRSYFFELFPRFLENKRLTKLKSPPNKD